MLASLLAILVALFAVQNSVTTTVVFLAWRFESSLAVLLLMTFALGVACMALVGTPASLRQRWSRRQQRLQIEQLQAEIRDLQSRLETARAEVPQGRLIEAGKADAATE